MGRVLTQTANHRSPCGPHKVTVRPLQSMVRPPQGRGVPRSSHGDRTVASRWPRGDLRFLLSLGCLKITRQPYDIQHIVRSPHVCRTGERLSHKAMLTNPPTHICVTWLQGVNEISIIAVTGMLQDKNYSNREYENTALGRWVIVRLQNCFDFNLSRYNWNRSRYKHLNKQICTHMSTRTVRTNTQTRIYKYTFTIIC